MSNRSKRRAAELAVIDAARRCHVGDANLQPAVAKLSQAVQALDALPPPGVGRVYVGADHPQTSREAADWVASKVGELIGEVFISIAAAANNGARGLTTDQLQQRLWGAHQSISPRVTELRQAGWITDSGIRRKTRSGRAAIVWEPTDLGWAGYTEYLREAGS